MSLSQNLYSLITPTLVIISDMIMLNRRKLSWQRCFPGGSGSVLRHLNLIGSICVLYNFDKQVQTNE